MTNLTRPTNVAAGYLSDIDRQRFLRQWNLSPHAVAEDEILLAIAVGLF